MSAPRIEGGSSQRETPLGVERVYEREVKLRHPDGLARLQCELAGEDAERHLEAVVNKTLRVRPVIELVACRLSAPLELGGYGGSVGDSLKDCHREALLHGIQADALAQTTLW